MKNRFIICVHQDKLTLLISNKKYTITRTKENLIKLNNILQSYLKNISQMNTISE